MLTCDYGTGWLNINALLLLTMFMIISFVYLLSRNLPSNTRARLTGVTKIELTQLFISVFIVLALFSITSVLCTVTQSVSNPISSNPYGLYAPNFGSSVPFPALVQPVVPANQASDPFSFAESFVGNYSFGIGPQLAIQVYAYSFSFAIESAVWTHVSSVVSELLEQFNPFNNTPSGAVDVSINTPILADSGIPYGILSGLFLDYLSPLVMLGISTMLVQYLILIVSNATAFALLLPLAIVLRSIAFTGGPAGLRHAANSILAIAIGLYIIYPVMIVFDSYILHWIFYLCPPNGTVTTMCNPSATYLQQTYTHENLQGIVYVNASENLNILGLTVPIQNQNIVGILASVGSQAGTAFNAFAGYSADATILGVQAVVIKVSEFLFSTLLMFALNITVVVGFTLGLTKALDSGIEGAASFWSS